MISGALRDAEVERMNIAAPDDLAEAVEEKGEADRRHEQDDLLLIDQRAQHQPLDREWRAATMIAAAMSEGATQIGTPRSISRQRSGPRTGTIVPWAKLNTPDALKISTKPSATSEYMTPLNSPPMMTSRTGIAGCPTYWRTGVRKTAARSMVLALLLNRVGLPPGSAARTAHRCLRPHAARRDRRR